MKTLLGPIIILFLLKTISASPYTGKLSCALLSDDKIYNNETASDIILASRPVKDYVFFYLYTRMSLNGEQFTLTDSSIASSQFSNSRPSKIITHGYFASKNDGSCANIKAGTGDYNVIVVDWSKMQHFIPSLIMPYGSVVRYVPKVASYVAEMIEFLKDHGMILEDTTLIGHSLGAHVMGIAGSKLITKVNYIVGLDPAGPEFEDKPESDRLSPDDAIKVHVIHTNSGNCGIMREVGNFDFRPNGGVRQPGCGHVTGTNRCAHTRAHELYAESIYNKIPFYGRLCPDVNTAVNGECSDGEVIKMVDMIKVADAKDGNYYVKTGKNPPYAVV